MKISGKINLKKKNPNLIPNKFFFNQSHKKKNALKEERSLLFFQPNIMSQINLL